ncbi:MAG: biopolymer transporter ExbD [Planctomycetaceae bacterium]|nr:biopolymer transporter ExbD [Planctomycetaceae bacterium]
MPLKTIQDDPPSINLTPLIDVVFNLIIFFMVTTTFGEWESSMAVKVPQVKQAGALAPGPEKRVVNVLRDGRVVLDRDIVSLPELTQRLATVKQRYSDISVVVRGDADGAFQNVASVLSACREAGISDMGISVRLAQGSDGIQSR